MDLTSLSVSNASIVCMVISVCISMILPIAAFIYWRNKTQASVISAVLGILTFVVFAVLLEQLLHTFIIANFSNLLQNIYFYAIYGGLAAGLFEESGRLVVMKYLNSKKRLLQKESIMYGIGHGGIESIMVIGMAYISNIATAMAINNGTISSIFIEGNDEMNETLYIMLEELTTLPPANFLYAGIERISAFFLQICLSYFVYRAVKDSKISLYIIAIMIHALVDSGLVLLSTFMDSVAVLEAILFVTVTLIAYFVIKEYKKERLRDNTDLIV